ncbi:hypothetical protein AVEN_270790-1 [Araneus ventricosus]|uniref:Uncharacterized protein n=1 Tax=Araneus ventricosus TaxID=182803 RepID=A0A4Y2HZC7_ARAVE|nr:hypothetical protein AVEN_270790-1 [Araneus ventricosus]
MQSTLVRLGRLGRLADRFTALYRKYQTNSFTGPANTSNSPLAMRPSSATSRHSVSILQTTADVRKQEILYTTQRDAHLLSQFIDHWGKSALSSKLSRRSIDHLITFLATNEDLIKSQNITPSHTPA